MRWLPLAAAIFLVLAPQQAGARGKQKQKRTLDGVVNLNAATLEQLTMLPGIGPVVAQRIIDSRAEKPFERPWELTRVKGIGSKLYRKLEAHLQTTGDSTLRWREAPRPTRRSGARRKGPKIIVFTSPQRSPQAVETAGSEGFVGPRLPTDAARASTLRSGSGHDREGAAP